MSSLVFDCLCILDVLREVGGHAGWGECARISYKDDSFTIKILLGPDLLRLEAIFCGVEADNRHLSIWNNISNFNCIRFEQLLYLVLNFCLCFKSIFGPLWETLHAMSSTQKRA